MTIAMVLPQTGAGCCWGLEYFYSGLQNTLLYVNILNQSQGKLYDVLASQNTVDTILPDVAHVQGSLYELGVLVSFTAAPDEWVRAVADRALSD